MKVNHAFKAKMEAFCDKNGQVEGDTILLHWIQSFLDRDENSFLHFQTRNPAQTITFGHILLDRDLRPVAGVTNAERTTDYLVKVY